MAKLKDYELTKKQLLLCDELAALMRKMRKAGLECMAKQYDLCIYRKETMKDLAPCADYREEADRSIMVPLYRGFNLLFDSGADDMEYFKKGVITE